MDLDCVTTRKDVIQALRREEGRDADFGVHIFGPNQAEQFMAAKTAAIGVRGAARARITARGVGDEYVRAGKGAVTYVSVYLTPNCAAAEFLAKVALLEDGIRDLPGDLVVAGDLNARTVEWGMTVTNKRGRLLLEMAASLDLVMANTGDIPTYGRPGFRDSIPDVTMTTDRTLPRIGRWRVLEGYTASDHQYIAFEFSAVLAAVPAPITDVPPELTGRQRAERLADDTAKLTTRLCDSTMPKRQYGRNRPPQYWWTDEIAELRKSCLAKRRRVTRAGGRPERKTLQAEYKTERKRLTHAIRDSNTR
ncbi:uncharacterized protein LOC124187035 [Neodiprion fabricii]|uniref:uncharacterized protein LOC124187035 n=1 Tax=Neodiprion fabricii TaxID=2872261 RepID=UPI001ED9653B|nr:uncharacterized protein LOC124187035 [Neodiprion fabricii]